jgi:acetylornithine/succinyldiaminopimelate/putrescine aminotransferase
MCATIGHNHPRVVKALELSAQRILHLNSTLLAPETVELAERLASLLPPSLSNPQFFCSSQLGCIGMPVNPEAADWPARLLDRQIPRRSFG